MRTTRWRRSCASSGGPRRKAAPEMADTLREALAERYETALRAICHGHTVGLGAAALADLARAALSGEAAMPLAPSPLLVDGRLSGESAVPLAQVTQTLVTQAKDLDPGFAAILEHHFDALLSRPVLPLRVEAPAQFAIGDTLVVHGYSPYWDGFEGRVIGIYDTGICVINGLQEGKTTAAGFDVCHLRRVEAPAQHEENDLTRSGQPQPGSSDADLRGV